MSEQDYQDYRNQRLGNIGDEAEQQAAETPEADDQDSPPEVEEAIQAEDAGPQDDVPGDDEPEEPKPRRNNRTEKRFRQLTERLRDKDAEIADLAGQVKTLTEMMKAPEKQEQPDADARPQRDSYDDDDAYIEALADWRADKRVKEELSRYEQDSAVRSQEREAQRLSDAYAEKLEAARERHDDYDEVVGESDLIVSADVKQAILESDLGPEVVYYLATNPKDVEHLNGLSSVQLGRAMGRIEASLEDKDEKEEEPDPPPRRRRRQPRPIEPVSGGGNTDTQPTRVDQSSYRDYREKRLAGKVR